MVLVYEDEDWIKNGRWTGVSYLTHDDTEDINNWTLPRGIGKTQP
jgi:hypothetical protein